MPSHLTRRVFRRLLANEPIFHHGCLRQSQLSLRRSLRAQIPSTVTSTQRRTFFNIFQPAPRTSKVVDLEPGMDKLMEYEKKLRLNARLPPVEEIEEAFRAYFTQKARNTKRTVEDEQLKYLLPALEYLCENHSSLFEDSKLATNIMQVFGVRSRSPSSSHADFALRTYGAVEEQLKQKGERPSEDLVFGLVKALCAALELQKARQSLVELYHQSSNLGESQAIDTSGSNPDRTALKLWRSIIHSFMLEKNDKEFQTTVETMKSCGYSDDDPDVCMVMAVQSSQKDDVAATKTWYDRYRKAEKKENDLSVKPMQSRKGSDVPVMTQDLYENLIKMCLRERELTWGQSLINDMVTSSPKRELWNLVFYWAAGIGKGADEIGRMMDVMERSQKESGQNTARQSVNINTINKLVELAISRDDPYLAERFVQLGQKRGISPNAWTLIYQMQYRLSVKDVDGALVAYQTLQSHDISGHKDVPAVNRLICALCSSGRHDFDTIMNVAGDLSDRQAEFTAETVSTLAILHLARGELTDVIDLLNTHVSQLSTAGRTTIRHSLLDYSRRAETTTSQAWDTYTIVRQVFDEMNRDERTKMMQAFFDRERSDMAVNIFIDMRRHTRADTASNMDTYVTCLLGIAQVKDEESLDAVHNQLKLDYSIEPSTRLLNALMIAYIACEDPGKALNFWGDITSSREGPNIGSIHLAFRACESAPFGDTRAQHIWARLGKTGLEFDQPLWASYLAGRIGNGNVVGTISELQEALKEGLVEVDSYM